MMWDIGSTFLSDTLTPGAKHLHVLVTKPYLRQDGELAKQKIRVYPRFNLQAQRKILEGLNNSPRARSNYVLIACNQLEEINWEEE